MPELPEVHTLQKFFDRTSVGRRIEAVEVHDAAIIRNLDKQGFIDRLTGRRFTGSYRRGKYLFAHLDNGRHLQLHFGMTGDLFHYREEQDRPPYERFAFLLDDGYRLGYDCPRKLARILYIEDLDRYLAEQVKLGPDALEINEEEFLRRMRGKKGSVKAFLMNQQNVAGLGNLYVDETCYQARVHPASRVDHLNGEVRRRLFRKMHDILQYAVSRDPHYKNYEPGWFWAWRREGQPGPEGCGRVQKTEIAGRTTYFCEEWQILY